MKTSEILVSARALIANPLHWMQGDYIKEAENEPTCYCSLGAIGKVVGCYWYGDVLNGMPAKLLARVVEGEIPTDCTFAPYNDSHTHTEVLAAFDKAIALALTTEV